ncbi:MAG: ubiquinone biosynthesis protein UbiB [Alphaproteobacteria bacterium PA4]|nr:MAG: ubiquinone biosynthesis protein UbiB [Alphaproteobacteria bacterium PA4]
MTATVTHLWRMLVWGRRLARHGALRPFESAKAPLSLRLVARVARIGTGAPKTPDFAAGLSAVGPAAVKLGQALATRPDLIGEAATRDLVRLQDSLPPLPFAEMEIGLNAAYGGDWRTQFQSIDPVAIGAASMAQVHRGITSDGRQVAIKMLRPGIEKQLAEAIATYEWAAGHIELLGGEFARLRPRAVIATFKGWTEAELDLRREAANASELAETVEGEMEFVVPGIDWARSTRRILVIDWIDGVKMGDTAGLAALDFDRSRLARVLVNGFLAQAIAKGFFHADMHQGNLFVIPPQGDLPARLGVIDFGIMGRINRRARMYLAEILHGLVTGNYARVAEIHFEAGYVPPRHNVGAFATALRAVGEPIRGKRAKDVNITQLLDGLFAITRSFDMPVQPHLLLLQKTMVMVEGVALTLDPQVNMWEVAEPYVAAWVRDEMGPEAVIADALVENARAFAQLPRILRQWVDAHPIPGAAPEGPALPPLPARGTRRGWSSGALALAAGLGAAAVYWLG